jgi:hypothetical protein
MVYYFKSNVVEPAAFIYVGKDKVESKVETCWPFRKILIHLDEELIKYGWDEDVWVSLSKGFKKLND